MAQRGYFRQVAPGDPNPAPGPSPSPAPAPAPTPTGPISGGILGGYSEPDFGTFRSPGYSGSMSPTIRLDQQPRFVAPEFKLPSFQDAMNDPGYQFRLASGEQALQRAAAAKGLTRSGGTLKDLIQYGQNFGAQEYQNVFNRNLQAYQQKYQGEYDKTALAADLYKTTANIEAQRALAAFQREGDVWAGNRSAAQYADSRMLDVLSQVYQ